MPYHHPPRISAPTTVHGFDPRCHCPACERESERQARRANRLAALWALDPDPASLALGEARAAWDAACRMAGAGLGAEDGPRQDDQAGDVEAENRTADVLYGLELDQVDPRDAGRPDVTERRESANPLADLRRALDRAEARKRGV